CSVRRVTCPTCHLLNYYLSNMAPPQLLLAQRVTCSSVSCPTVLSSQSFYVPNVLLVLPCYLPNEKSPLQCYLSNKKHPLPFYATNVKSTMVPVQHVTCPVILPAQLLTFRIVFFLPPCYTIVRIMSH
ncbi:hypothetical protein J6590_103871, partial [Homalodisca vitripennis]